MEKQELIKMEGIITECLPNAIFRILLPNGFYVIAYISGKMRRYSIRLIVKDKVKVELSPYDLTRGRITYRLKK